MGLPNQLAFVHSSDKPSRPKLLEIRSGKPFIIFTVAFAVSTDIFMYGLLVPLTPTILEHRVGIPKEQSKVYLLYRRHVGETDADHQVQSWTSILLALYSAAFLFFSPVLGHLADRAESRRWPLFLGILALGVATALLCIGTNIGLWIAGRLCQGAAVAVVWTVGLALLVDTVGPDELGQAIGYVSMGLNTGVLAGPLLGGVLYQHGGYYAVFGLAFGFVCIDLLLRLVLIEKRNAAQWLVSESTPSTPPDRQNLTEKQTGHSVLQTDKRTNHSQTPTHDAHPLRQLAALLSSPRLLICLWAHFVLSLLLTSFDSVLPLFVHDLFAWRQAGQGLIFAALVIPHLLDPLIGLFIDRYPTTTRYLISGAFLCAVPPAVLLRLITTNSTRDKVRLCVFLALLGFCIALATTPVTLEIFLTVKEKEDEVPGRFGRGGAVAFAFGLSNMAFAAGSLVGPFFAGYIRQNASWGTMGWAIGVITGVTSVLALLWSGGRILKKAS